MTAKAEQAPAAPHGADAHMAHREERTSTKAMRWGVGGTVLGLGLEVLGFAIGSAATVAVGAVIWPVAAVVAVGGAVASLFGRKKH